MGCYGTLTLHGSWLAKISIPTSRSSILSTSRVFFVGLRIPLPINFTIFVTKLEVEIQEATMTLADAKEISFDASG